MHDVVLFEVFEEEERALRKYLPKTISAQFISKTIQESGVKKTSAALLCVRTQSVIPTAWAARLEGILTRSTGYDHLLAFRKRPKTKIPCGYLGDYCGRAVAEQAMLLVLALQREFKQQLKNFKTFNRDSLTGGELAGKNLLVFGVGAIGSQVVDIAKGLRMNVRGVDIVRRLKNFPYVSLNEGTAWAEAIVCAAPLTARTVGLLDYQRLKKCHRGTILINISRGEITPLNDLKRLLEEGILGGLGMDVFPEEGRLAESLRTGRRKNSACRIIQQLNARHNVLFTPHNAFNTHEAVERKASETVRAVKYFLEYKTFPRLVPNE